MNYTFKWFTRSVLLTPIILIVAMILMGGGHGWYEPAIVLLPLGFTTILLTDSLNVASFILAALQFPLYGLMIDIALNKKELKWAVLAIAASHTAIAVSILMFRDDTWR